MEPASQEHHVGKVIFVELVTPDLAGAERFYGGLFGWTFHDIAIGQTEYAEAFLNGHLVAGIARKDMPPGERRQPAWLGFIAVNDVDAASKAATGNGAKLLSAPHTVTGRGREGVFAYPQGAVFAILASTSGDPPDLLAAAGEWIWSSIITSDPETDAAFYQKLFHHEVFDLPADGDIRLDGGMNGVIAQLDAWLASPGSIAAGSRSRVPFSGMERNAASGRKVQNRYPKRISDAD